ncbi:MAG: hypothetical protein AAF149_09095 [Bacteroidota bacterium]
MRLITIADSFKMMTMKYFLISLFLVVMTESYSQNAVHLTSERLTLNDQSIDITSEIIISDTILVWDQTSGEGYRLEFDITNVGGNWSNVDNRGKRTYALSVQGQEGTAVLKGARSSVQLKIAVGQDEYVLAVDNISYQ